MKKKSSKSLKIDIFPNGLTHAFGPKMAIFPGLFFRQYRLGKCLLQYCRTKKRLSRLLKKLTKSENWHFSKGVNPCFWSKNGLLSNLFFLGNIGQKNVFYNILEQKNGFVGYKNMKFKKSKNWYFSKGNKPCFWSKNAIFFSFNF